MDPPGQGAGRAAEQDEAAERDQQQQQLLFRQTWHGLSPTGARCARAVQVV